MLYVVSTIMERALENRKDVPFKILIAWPKTGPHTDERHLVFKFEQTAALTTGEATELAHLLQEYLEQAPSPTIAEIAKNIAGVLLDAVAQTEGMSRYGPH